VTDTLTVFEQSRARLFGLAYRMLGSVEDAEDLVQEAYLRWHQADREEVRTAEAWLVSVTTRLSIDRLRRLAVERGAYPGNWLPEPIATDPASAPEWAAEQTSDLSVAFLFLLERLGPEERAAFLLREVFDTGYDEIGMVLDKSEAAVRQLVHRARERVRQGRARFPAPPPRTKQRMLERFLAALRSDSKEDLLALFAEDAVLVGDGGGKVAAALQPLHGGRRIANLFWAAHRKGAGRYDHRIAWINGEPAVVTSDGGEAILVLAVETDGERILACYNVLNPDKLRRV
jgi:RNA polymerase sigma-70 factor (ECF subfamily)